jgi:hypothetical protein
MEKDDDEGSPTDEFFQFIKDYKPEILPIMEFIDILFDSWQYNDWGFTLHRQYGGKRKLELHTAGWSGNESIIDALLSNIYLTHFSMQYKQWKTGGHFYFEIPIKP